MRWGIADTPAACASKCKQAGFRAAGVTYIARRDAETYPYGLCLCGAAYSPAVAQLSPLSECASRCALGSDLDTCGGVDRAQVYTLDPPVAPALPAGWAVARFCAVDVPSRVLVGAAVAQLAGNTPAVCAAHCAAAGYAYAGVEYGNECQCGTGYVGGALPPSAEQYQCDAVRCPGDASTLCGGSWRIQLYKYAAPA